MISQIRGRDIARGAMSMGAPVASVALLCAMAFAALSEARADDAGPVLCPSWIAQPPSSDQPAAEAPKSWLSATTFAGHVDAGIMGNPDGPKNGVNFGRLFDDRANEPVLNQLWGCAIRPVGAKPADWDFGFGLQLVYGADARFLHMFNLFDHSINATNQFAIFEGYGSVHVPGIAEGGTDAKIGILQSPLGYESTDATQNQFYSHSYISNFGVTSQNTGFLSITHLTSTVDLYFGLDTGANQWLGSAGGGLNNSTWLHGQAGFALNNLADGKVNLTALTHIGPENPKRVFGSSADSALRYFNDAFGTWRVTDKLLLATELNYIHDDLLRASAYGGAQYLVYTIDDHWSAGIRGEVYRDNNGAFVASFRKPFDFINSARGLPTSPGGVVGGGRTTYGALTLGVNFRPDMPDMLKAFKGLVIRPEVRFDDALNGTKPFVDSKQGHQVTIGADVVVPFSM
jgi:hypothetical protein